MTTLRIGTRGSALALWQAEHVRALLGERHPDLQTEIVVIRTKGDMIVDRPLAEIGGKGLFLKEIEEALLAGVVDLAVHSMKDVPWEDPEGLELCGVLERADPFDRLCAGQPLANLDALPTGARVGTGSLRRGAQLLRLRPDVEIVPIRGNVPTRLARAGEEGDLDAVVLAGAGLDRLGLNHPGHLSLQPPDVLPAPAQGAVVLQCRQGDAHTRTWVDGLAHAETEWLVRAERRCLHSVEGDCHTPFGAWAHLDQAGTLHLHARLLDPSGSAEEAMGCVALGASPLESANALGAEVGDRLRAAWAAR